MTASGVSIAKTISEEDALRAHYYRFMACLLADVPDAEVLSVASSLDGDDTELGRALDALGAVARSSQRSDIKDEYHALFLGLGRGELVPFASYYLTGFLNEKPLADLRSEMARLGIARADEVKEPEDHIASLCEIMAGMIEGGFDRPADLEEQRAFFNRFLAPWAGRFFEDLEAAESARFYMPVGTIGRLFMSIEGTAFEMLG